MALWVHDFLSMICNLIYVTVPLIEYGKHVLKEFCSGEQYDARGLFILC